jgi:hypothetical protein
VLARVPQILCLLLLQGHQPDRMGAARLYHLASSLSCVCYFCVQILRRLLLHGFQPDCKTLQPVPAVNIIAPSILSHLLGV